MKYLPQQDLHIITRETNAGYLDPIQTLGLGSADWQGEKKIIFSTIEGDKVITLE